MSIYRVIVSAAIGSALIGLIAYQGGNDLKVALITAGVAFLRDLNSRFALPPADEAAARRNLQR